MMTCDNALLSTNQKFLVVGEWVVHKEFSVQLRPTLKNIMIGYFILLHKYCCEYILLNLHTLIHLSRGPNLLLYNEVKIEKLSQRNVVESVC